jgi:hypothetical protein
MPATYEPIATTTLGSATNTITFSSIPSTYTDLRIVLSAICVVDGDIANIRLNGSSSSIYSFTGLRGNGSAITSARQSSQTSIRSSIGGNDINTIPSLITFDIFSYAGSINKTLLCSSSADQNGSGTVQSVVGLFRSTSAITSITLSSIFSSNYAVGTTATLYGILKA